MYKTAIAVALAWMTLNPVLARAEIIPVRNHSFETPAVASGLGVDIRIDSWQETPKPDWYDDSGDYKWDQLCGVFTNTPPGDPAYIDNCDGKQAMYLFAVPQVGVFQDYDSTDWANSVPTHAFDARYEVGKSYQLTVGLIGGGGAMLEGATVMLGLYYRDGSNMVTVAATNVAHSRSVWPTNTHFVDYGVSLPAVKAGDAWAGKNIGIQIISSATPDKAGGYWDVDNVRLTANISVPNHSFETPAVASGLGVDIRIDSWQETPKPDWYDDSGDYKWDQLCGVFTNTPPGDPAYIDNCDGKQAMYLFAVPQVGVFQDYDSTDWANPVPTHAFNARYEVGKSYQLTVGLIGGGGAMLEGATVMLGLYYRDGSNMVTVAATNVAHSRSVWPTNTHFVDYGVSLPAVKAGDAWAGKNIGIQIISSATPDKAGGYWDVDNVRLTSAGAPLGFSLSVTKSEGGLRISWPSAAGWRYQLRNSGDLKAWSDYEAPVAGTGGELSKVVPIGTETLGFFTVVATPGP